MFKLFPSHLGAGKFRLAPALALTATAAVFLGACSSPASTSNADLSPTATTSASATISVATSLYPLQYLVQEIGGDLVSHTSLTPAGGEPHDVELSPAQIAAMSGVDLMVYLGGFQHAVDDAITNTKPAHVLNVANAARLEAPATSALTPATDTDHDHSHDHGDDHSHDHSHATMDPHFWQDPLRMVDVAKAISTSLSEVATTKLTDATARTKATQAIGERTTDLIKRLTALNDSYTAGLASCSSRAFITTHTAFSYLAKAHGLTQFGITGLDPHSEPSPARLAQITALATANKVTTIFYDSAADTKIADTLASQLHLSTALLDPVEAMTTPGATYETVMAANLANLRKALACS